jgi:hypothetical protein
MASELGPIQTDYRSPKITDDLVQLGAGQRQAEVMNLASQMGAREMQNQNVASQITQRGVEAGLARDRQELAREQAEVDADYKYNLINMNRAKSAREEAKLPYELEGLDARNWVNQTVAHNNELKNELLDLTMVDQIETERLNTQTAKENLNQKRITNEAMRQEQAAYSDYLPALMDYWTGVENNTVNPEKDKRPSYGGSKRLNDLHAQRMDEHRRSISREVDLKSATVAAAVEATQRASLTPAQQSAEDAANLTQNQIAKIRQASLETNASFARLRLVSPTEAESIIQQIRGNIDPVTRVAAGTAGTHPTTNLPFTTPQLVDANGNLTPDGKRAAADAGRRLGRAAAMRHAPPVGAQDRADFILNLMKTDNPATGENYTGDDAEAQWDARHPSVGGWGRTALPNPYGTQNAAGQRAASTARNNIVTGGPTSAYQILMSDGSKEGRDTLNNVDRGIAVLYRMDEHLRSEDNVADERGYDNTTGEPKAADKDIDYENYQDDNKQFVDGSSVFNPLVEWSGWEPLPFDTGSIDTASTVISDHTDTARQGIDQWRKLINEGMDPAQLFDVFQPHPHSLATMQVVPPDWYEGSGKQSVRGYIDVTPDVIDYSERWITVPVIDLKTKQLLSIKQMQDWIKKKFPQIDANKFLIEGVHFTRSNFDAGRPGGRPLADPTATNSGFTWEDYQKKGSRALTRTIR